MAEIILAVLHQRMKQEQRTTALSFFRNTTRAWFVITYAGQLFFAFYILMLYWRSTASGHFDKWNTVNPHFYVKADTVGNVVFALHVVFAAIVTILGPLQLISRIRQSAPGFHRICGRIYIYSAFLVSIDGFYLTWVRGAVGGPVSAATISINALIIVVCAFCCIRHAVRRNIKLHNQWAVHLLLAMSGVWLFRIFFMLWMVIFQRPVGFDPETFTGPFLYTLDVFVYILPQAVVYIYFRVKFSGSALAKNLFSVFLVLITIAMLVGIAGAIGGMWLPRI